MSVWGQGNREDAEGKRTVSMNEDITKEKYTDSKRAKHSIKSNRLRVCRFGVCCLRIFCITCVMAVTGLIVAAFQMLPDRWLIWTEVMLCCGLTEALLFWTGIICVYCTSVQLGIRYRIIGIACGMIPVVHLVILGKIIHTVSEELRFETNKERLNLERSAEQICHTRYPLLMVHGVFFRDFRYLNYWGRIPEELIRNGACIYYGNHESAASVEISAQELTARIKQIVCETGCEKVNIIAHSKGGLDCRYAISHCGAAPYVASLTTINTPHRGCEFADYLLQKIPEKSREQVAGMYNKALRRLGDRNPDFISSVTDLTACSCTRLNQNIQTEAACRCFQNIYCQSIGSKLNHAVNGRFPLNFTYPLVKHFDGANDGLVSEKSFAWGERYELLTVQGKRGISHGDMIDLNRENIPGFDVREFYVQLAAGLKRRGL